jgi:predicted transcriptional regulator
LQLFIFSFVLFDFSINHGKLYAKRNLQTGRACDIQTSRPAEQGQICACSIKTCQPAEQGQISVCSIKTCQPAEQAVLTAGGSHEKNLS